MAADECGLIVYSVVNLTGAVNQRRKSWTIYFVLSLRDLLFSPCWHCLNRAVGSPLVMDPNSICRKTKRLAGKQAELCQTQPEIVSEVAKGARLGIRECQYQFRYRRWNCTSHNKYFGKILQQGEWRSETGVFLSLYLLLSQKKETKCITPSFKCMLQA